MEQRIDSDEVSGVEISHQRGNLVHSVHAYIVKNMTPEREAELAHLVEQAIIVAIKGFVKA